MFIVRDDRIEDATAAVRGLRRASARPAGGKAPPPATRPATRSMRVLMEGSRDGLKVAAWGVRGVRVGDDLVDLKDTTLAGDGARLRAVAALLKRAASNAPTWRPFEEVLDELEAATARPVFERLEEPGLADLARPSRIEIAQALARWKRVTFRVAAGRLSGTTEGPP